MTEDCLKPPVGGKEKGEILMRKKLVNSLIAGTMLGILCALPVFAETETAEGVTGVQSVSENSTETVSGNDIEEGDIAIDEAHFPDEKFRNYVSENFDNDEDGNLSEEEIDNVTEIDVSESGIESLKGIEYFSKLTYLSCESNQLTSLDVSKNTALEYLYCSENKLTSLDVSQNPALTWLYCYENQLTSLDVSKTTALYWLHCIDNQLTSLDVSQNPALTALFCGYNQLTSLDVSNNTALYDLYCENNQLTSLDVSNNTALNLLSCGGNQLTDLDVRHNTNLTGLYCEKNQLTKLDISKCNGLLKYRSDPDIKQKIEDSRVRYYADFGYDFCVFSYDENVMVIDGSEDTIDPAPVPTPTPAPGSTPSSAPGTAKEGAGTDASTLKPQTPASTGTQGSAPVVKKANTVKVTVKPPSVKAKNKKQAISASKIFKVSKAQGKVSYKKVSGSKNLTISKTGKITVKKGTKAGTYKIKVAITAAGNENYKAKTVNKTVKVKVKK